MKREQLCGAMILLAAALVIGDAAAAQPPGRGGPRDGVLGLLQSDAVQQEIDLVDEQREELETMRDEIRGEMQEMFRSMRDLSAEERREQFGEMRSRFEEIRERAEGRLSEVLMPHQLERLRQIELQRQIERGGGEALLGGRLAEELNITDQQREELQAKAAEVQAEMQEKVQALRAEAREKLLSVLTKEQRARYDAMVGDQFAMPEEQRGFRGFDRGRRGEGRRGRPAADQADSDN